MEGHFIEQRFQFYFNFRLQKKISLLEGELTELTDFDALLCQKNEEIEK